MPGTFYGLTQGLEKQKKWSEVPKEIIQYYDNYELDKNPLNALQRGLRKNEEIGKISVTRTRNIASYLQLSGMDGLFRWIFSHVLEEDQQKIKEIFKQMIKDCNFGDFIFVEDSEIPNFVKIHLFHLYLQDNSKWFGSNQIVDGCQIEYVFFGFSTQ